MLKSKLKSTTSLALCLVLAAPPVFAQDSEPVFPCVTDAGVVVDSDSALADALIAAATGDAAVSDTTPACVISPAVQEAVSAATAAAVAAAAEQAAAEAAAAEQAAADAAAAEQAAAEAAAAEQAAADAAAAEQAAADAAAAEQAAADAAAADAAAAEQAATEAAAAEAAAAEQAAAAAATDQAATDAAAAEQAAADAAAAEQAAADAAAAEQAAADAAAAEQAAADAAAAEQAAADAAAAAAAGSEQAAPAEPADATTTTEAAPEVVVEEAPVAAAAATAETDATAAEVVTEELTDADVRSSNEDFTTTVTGTAAPQTETTTQNRDKGLSNFEKALLLGLGAVVVGSVLNNGDEVVSNSGDRVVVQRGDELRVLKNDDVLLRQPGSEIATETFSDGSTRTTITRADGTQIVTIRSNDGRVLRRARVMPDGSQVALFDDTVAFAPVDVTTLPAAAPQQVAMSSASDSALRDALLANLLSQPDRTFSLDQVREIRQVRTLAPQVELDTVTFASGSAAIDPSQAEQLGTLGRAISAIVVDNPNTVFLIEGHTDAVGAASYNLALSDRRAETVALALTEYFGVPPENLITQGYGEEFLKIDTQTDERANRRAAVRNITSLLR